MLPSARLFVCARCRCQVTLCRACDRGQIYCGPACSNARRTERLREARRRHAGTRRGRIGNAERQRRHRARTASHDARIVTEHGSAAASAIAPSANAPDTNSADGTDRVDPIDTRIRCHRCRRVCDPFLRTDFLRPEQRDRRSRTHRQEGHDP